MRTVINCIASLVEARANCLRGVQSKPQLAEWIGKHASYADKLAADYLPSGSGFDSGTRIDWSRSRPERIVFATAFHHMDENGFYDGWTEHSVTVRPSLAHVFTVTVSGKDRNGIRDYIADAFRDALSGWVKS
jgi:hypothetical protein